jgi:N-acylneuraminate cytidylyltransferase
MKIVGIIPARGGSKGIPRKNIKLLAGKPLVAYTIEAGINSKYIDRVIVSTEDNEIANVSMEYGAEVIKRPFELAQDETKTAPVIEHVVTEIEQEGYYPDIIVLLQPTCPLRNEKTIDAVLEQLMTSDKDSIFTGFVRGQAMPLWQKNSDGTLTALYDYHLRPRRQDANLRGTLYCEDGAVYAIRREAFAKTKDFLGENVGIFVMDHQPDIDTVQDFEAAEKAILNIRNSLEKLKLSSN